MEKNLIILCFASNFSYGGEFYWSCSINLADKTKKNASLRAKVT